MPPGVVVFPEMETGDVPEPKATGVGLVEEEGTLVEVLGPVREGPPTQVVFLRLGPPGPGVGGLFESLPRRVSESRRGSP